MAFDQAERLHIEGAVAAVVERKQMKVAGISSSASFLLRWVSRRLPASSYIAIFDNVDWINFLCQIKLLRQHAALGPTSFIHQCFIEFIEYPDGERFEQLPHLLREISPLSEAYRRFRENVERAAAECGCSPQEISVGPDELPDFGW